MNLIGHGAMVTQRLSGIDVTAFGQSRDDPLAWREMTGGSSAWPLAPAKRLNQAGLIRWLGWR
jgi:hypothetical protein